MHFKKINLKIQKKIKKNRPDKKIKKKINRKDQLQKKIKQKIIKKDQKDQKKINYKNGNFKKINWFDLSGNELTQKDQLV